MSHICADAIQAAIYQRGDDFCIRWDVRIPSAASYSTAATGLPGRIEGLSQAAARDAVCFLERLVPGLLVEGASGRASLSASR